ncbi:hypothetical protein B0H67DRAFT_578333 [Lasiosphaeris hirsuta]|uniref:Uncharacterized protein n=1 Tax=Lasiosphaeris hirsuta TaxID=260670 RepID=A0AA40DSG0_9PEZI|nr:hypothetical protein B0H67DRAFT_578333 [Lasiosphaeris hirsuta]
MCEHAAHQFLRDGNCTGEVGKLSGRMAETGVATVIPRICTTGLLSRGRSGSTTAQQAESL